MAAGALDPNGVWLYGEDDARDTFSDLLNIGQEATSDAIGADRARLAGLEAAGALSGVSAAAFTIATGWSVGSQQARRRNGMVFWRIRFTRTGAPLSPNSVGVIAPTLVAAINAEWTPAEGMTYPAVTGENGSLLAGGVYNSGGWGVFVTATPPAVPIATSSQYSLTGFYPLA